jgi:hypothetical protein
MISVDVRIQISEADLFAGEYKIYLQREFIALRFTTEMRMMQCSRR